MGPPRCFRALAPHRALVLETPLGLDEKAAQALARLLPILGCGEEAATLAFAALARDRTLSDADRLQLRAIADDELVHDALIDALRRALPDVVLAKAHSAATRRFHIGLRSGGTDLHLARIAALDAGVCTILSRLLKRGGAISCEPTLAAILRRIRRDESRHVAVSRRLALARSPAPALRAAAAFARSGLAAIIAEECAAFEDLGVDAGALVRDLERLPNGLLS